jgi:hypothetical protein
LDKRTDRCTNKKEKYVYIKGEREIEYGKDG